MHILMLGAENGALPGGKVGGMGDVLRDVPRALAALGHRVTVVCPAYGRFHRDTPARRRGNVVTPFRGRHESVEVYALPPSGPGRRVRQLLFEHDAFSACGRGHIYCNDPPGEPFATDSSKFALLCAGVAQALLDDLFDAVDVVHLHDWHAASLVVLLRLDAAFAPLRHQPVVFTVHNLAMQGIRPRAGHGASPAAWFPQLALDERCLDPRYADCYNPMRAAIRLADRVHVVSPTYAREICDPRGVQGEGLQDDLAEAREDGRLHGILNGCDYAAPVRRVTRASLFALAERELCRWIGEEDNVASSHFLALQQVQETLREVDASPGLLLTAVGRLTDQKLGLLADREADGRRVLDHLLGCLEGRDRLLVLGSGDRELEGFLARAQGRDPRLIFLCGYSEPLSEALYAAGDLFLMPSRFEPCGIAQMLAMRAGQPCLVSRTGGLADTVRDGENGFSFPLTAPEGPERAFLDRFDGALGLLREGGAALETVKASAAATRFPWSDTAKAYEERLYDLKRVNTTPMLS